MNETPEWLNDDEPTAHTEVIEIVADNEAEAATHLHDSDILGVLPLKNKVLFPNVLLPITVSRPKSKKLIKSCFEGEKLLAVVCQKQQQVQEPKLEDLYPLGCAAKVLRIIPINDGSQLVILQGIERIELAEIVEVKPYLKARITRCPELQPDMDDRLFVTLTSRVKEMALKVLSKMDNMPQDAQMGLRAVDYPPMVVNFICANFGKDNALKQEWLAISDLKDRAADVLQFLNQEYERLRVKQDIQKKTKAELDKTQREYFLHEQMHTIQKELGDTADKDRSELEQRAVEKHWDEAVKKVFEEELKKLQRMSTHSPEYAMQLNYLDVMLSLPWNEWTEDTLDIAHAQQVLDKDHYGMDEVKDRILEHLAVLQQIAQSSAKKHKQPVKTPILCLYGPPGVGKTSLGKSIAKALSRKYARISLGGLHDEAELRGHRRTYIGAMPGRIIENLRKVGSSNPVFVLDEIDKIGADYKGDPTAALLEILDPEQNKAFHDNFLDVDFDLSKVLFIATANSLQSIPRPLLDRMELIEMTGYLQEEKEQIAKRHLLPKELGSHGLANGDMKMSAKSIRYLIDNYTRESGVRELDRQVQNLIRKWIKARALGEEVPTTLQPEDVTRLLGKPRYSRDMYEDNRYVGVVTGLAWTQVGGEILFIETSLSHSKQPTLTLTGNLGDVMKESATIALGYIRSHAADFGIKQKDLDTHSVHLHVPEGAIPKDGPSAGITMTTAMISAFTHRKVRARLAMTGEMTLRGKVLPVGGIKEKILAAKRSGITDIMLCQDNEKDILDIKEQYLKGLTFHYVRDIHDVIRFALL